MSLRKQSLLGELIVLRSAGEAGSASAAERDSYGQA